MAETKKSFILTVWELKGFCRQEIGKIIILATLTRNKRESVELKLNVNSQKIIKAETVIR